MPLPTFVIAGAQKCGTSSLLATLRRHPEVVVSRPKELHYFDRLFRKHDLDWYAEQFAPRKRHLAWGEATPSYLYETAARERLCATLPDTGIVAILRDPAKRAYSHYWHSRRLGFEHIEVFEDALDAEADRLASGERSDMIRFSYLDRGHYIDQISDLFERHGRDKVHVMLLDDLSGDARIPALEGLFGFLGVDTAPAHTIEEQWTNRYRVAEGDAVKVVAYPPIAPETRARLVEHFQPWNDRLGDLLGRDLAAWNRV